MPFIDDLIGMCIKIKRKYWNVPDDVYICLSRRAIVQNWFW